VDACNRNSMIREDIQSVAENLRQSSGPRPYFIFQFLHIPFLDLGIASILADNIIPLIVKLHQFQPLVDALSFQIFPPEEPHSFKLRFDKLQDLDERFKPFITKFVCLIFMFFLEGG
jgi:hypothetical protein